MPGGVPMHLLYCAYVRGVEKIGRRVQAEAIRKKQRKREEERII